MIDYDSFRTGVNKLNHMFYSLIDQNIFLSGWSCTCKIDQMFSFVARRLAKNDAHTLEALKDQIKVSYTPSVLVEELLFVFEVKAWMENSMNYISGHIHQAVFKIQNDNGNSKLFYEKWSTSPVWRPDGGIRLISPILRGGPKLVKPNSLDGMYLDKLEMDLPKYAMKLQDSEIVW